MPIFTEAHIKAALSDVQIPGLQADLFSSNVLKKIEINKDTVRLIVVLPYPLGKREASLKEALTKRILSLEGVGSVCCQVSVKVQAHKPQPGVTGHASIKNIIAVGSGKGGVGKSTTTANLALALAAQGARVGVLDADIYGPNQPAMLGVTQKPELTEDKKFLPVLSYGLKTMSMGYLVKADTPMVWRGPMVSSALQQLLRDTQWGELDYLLLDLPPGTGDIPLTMAKKIPVSGAVIVTTPQDVALLDARKALEMFKKVGIPVLGVIENMAGHVCPRCQHEEAVFGEGGGLMMAEACEVPLLGALPLSRSIRENVDLGKPTVVAEPEGVLAQRYVDIAFALTAQLSKRPRNYSTLFPNVVIEENKK